MLVCIPSSNDTGLEAPIHEHFGSAPYFTLVNTDSRAVEIVENRNAHHAHGTCHPMNQLSRHKIDAVVCAGMGRRAVEALNAEGIRTLLSTAGTVGDAVAAIGDGSAEDIDPALACRGHGQHQSASGTGSPHGHGCGSGRGRHGGGRMGGGRSQ